MSLETYGYPVEKIEATVGGYNEFRQQREDESTTFLGRAIDALTEAYHRRVTNSLGMLTEEQRALNAKIGKNLSHYSILSSPHFKDRSKLEDVPWDLNNRVEASQNIALWYLLYTGALNQQDEETAVKIAEGFLQRIQRKNKEIESYEDEHLPTIGLEVEFLVSKYLEHELESKRNRALRLNKGSNSQQAGIKSDKAYSLIDTDIATNSFLYLREVGENPIVGEAYFHPTASAKTQLRELLHLIKSGIVPERVCIHINIGGLRLDADNTEPMVLTSILAGGVFNNRYFTDPFTFSPVPIKEKVNKRSDDEMLYPFHRARRSKFHYKDSTDRHSVEFRGISNFDKFTELVRATESVYWLSTAAMAKQKIKETNNEAVDDVTQKLAHVWDSMQQEWDQLLAKHRIDLATQNSITEGTVKMNEATTAHYNEETYKEVITSYNFAIGKIRLLAEADEKFRKQARKIIIKARKQVKEALDLLVGAPGLEPGTTRV